MRTLAAFVLWAGAATAAPIEQVPYATLAASTAGRYDFESFEPRPEPGLSVDGLLGDGRVMFGESFLGQTVTGTPFDTLHGAPTTPLTLRPGRKAENHAVAYHAGFGSVALFPLGPWGFPAMAARGEGAVAMRFAQDVLAVGLRVHSDYPDPLGSRPAPGTLLIRFYDRAGRLLDRHTIQLDPGLTELGFSGPPFAGVLITNTDPGGIAIDDILFPVDGLNS